MMFMFVAYMLRGAIVWPHLRLACRTSHRPIPRQASVRVRSHDGGVHGSSRDRFGQTRGRVRNARKPSVVRYRHEEWPCSARVERVSLVLVGAYISAMAGQQQRGVSCSGSACRKHSAWLHRPGSQYGLYDSRKPRPPVDRVDRSYGRCRPEILCACRTVRSHGSRHIVYKSLPCIELTSNNNGAQWR